jgi:hypothetical protein
MANYTQEKIKNPYLFQEAIRIYKEHFKDYPKTLLITANTENKLGIQDIESEIEVVVRDTDKNKNPDWIEKHFNEVELLENGFKPGKILYQNFCCDEHGLVKGAYIIKKY